MGSRAEARAARKEAQAAKFELTKAKILAAMDGIAQTPKVAGLPREEKLRLAVGAAAKDLVIPMQPRTDGNEGRMSMQVTWCVRKRDVDGSWSWGESRAWEDLEWHQTIEPAFNSFAQLSWQEVDAQASGEGHKLHHAQELSNISPEAQQRWLELDLEEFDPLFRFRMGNKKRFWGFILQGHFFGVWWEREHKIAPTSGTK